MLDVLLARGLAGFLAGTLLMLGGVATEAIAIYSFLEPNYDAQLSYSPEATMAIAGGFIVSGFCLLYDSFTCQKAGKKLKTVEVRHDDQEWKVD